MNIIKSAIFFICFSLLSSPLYAEGRTYYVTPTGNASDPDCSGGGAPSCAGAYDAGDFNRLSGDYSDDTFFFTGKFSTRLRVFVEGTSGHPVTIDGYYASDCDPINSVCSSSALLQQGMDIGDNSAGPDYITIQDFRMTKTSADTDPCFKVYPDVSESDDSGWSEGITIQRNYVYETYSAMVYIARVKYGTVENNKFTHFGQGRDATQGVNIVTVEDFVMRKNEIGHSEESYPSLCTSANVIELHGIQRGLFELNHIYGAPNQAGIVSKEDGYSPYSGDTDDVIIRFNKVHDNINDAAQGENSGRGIATVTRDSQSVSYTYIYGNMVYNNTIAGIQVSVEQDHVYIWSNILLDHARHGIYVMTKTGQTAPEDVYIYNNTIARNNTSGDTDDARGGITVTSGTNINKKNNLFWNNRPGGEGSKYNQIYSSVSLSSLESNTYYHGSSTPTFYYDGGFKSLSTMQKTYNKEDDPQAGNNEDNPLGGEIADPGFIDPAGPDNTYGTADDDYRLDGTYIKNGANLSKCFDVKVQGKNYHMCYNDALDPRATNWTTTPPTVRTIKRADDGLWDRGAYIYGDIDDYSKPKTGTSDIFQPGPDWCRNYGPCPEGQGDCDGDAECQSGLICAQDVGANYGWPAGRDVCERPAGTTRTSNIFQPGPDWCRDYGPCPEGQGDCDGDAECQSGLICAQNVGANYGWPAGRDVCEKPAGTINIFQPGPAMSSPSGFRVKN